MASDPIDHRCRLCGSPADVLVCRLENGSNDRGNCIGFCNRHGALDIVKLEGRLALHG